MGETLRKIFALVQDQTWKLLECELTLLVDEQGFIIHSQSGVQTYKIQDKSVRNNFYDNIFVFTVVY